MLDSTSLQPAVPLSGRDVERAAIAAGSEVVSGDLETVGVVRRLVFDRETGALTSITVHGGFRFARALDLPWTVIAKLEDGVVYLVRDTGEVRGGQ